MKDKLVTVRLEGKVVEDIEDLVKDNSRFSSKSHVIQVAIDELLIKELKTKGKK